MSPPDLYETLGDDIVGGRIGPGHRLVEADLAARYGVSRSTVRTALTRLAQDGIVTQERNVGASVRMVSTEEAIEILDVRAALEGVIARAAAERATPEDVAALRAILATMRAHLDAGDLLAASDQNAALHARIRDIGAHATAARLVTALRGQVVRHTFRTILVPGRSSNSWKEHGAIVDAIEAGDGDAAEAAMRHHLAGVAGAVRESAARWEP